MLHNLLHYEETNIIHQITNCISDYMMSLSYITDNIRSNITKNCYLTFVFSKNTFTYVEIEALSMPTIDCTLLNLLFVCLAKSPWVPKSPSVAAKGCSPPQELERSPLYGI